MSLANAERRFITPCFDKYTVLTATGHNPLPFSESEAYIYITLAVTVGVFVYGVWKNYPTSEAGRVADKVLHAVKSGAAQAQDVLNLLDEGATGGYKSALPFKGRNRVTQPYTYNASSKSGHGGIDIVGDDNKTVYAVEAGTVTMISVWDGKTKTGTQSYGNLVVVTDANGCLHYYAHLKSIAVTKGQAVAVGTIIGVMGNTGNSFGAHLHYEVRTGKTTSTRVNPADYIALSNAKGTYEALEASDVSPKEYAHSIGEHVVFSTCYKSSTAPMSEAIAAEKMSRNHGIITKIIDAQNPYLLDNGLCWVNDGDIRGQYSGNSTQSVASTSSAHKGTAYTITCDWLKVRKSPSTMSKVVGRISRGDTFDIMTRKGNWCQIGIKKWVCAGKYLKEAE